MIIVKIFQGLGNQLFQYAMGRALALRNGTELKLDTHYFAQFGEVTQYGFTYKREYELSKYNISAQLASVNECEQYMRPTMRGQRVLNAIVPGYVPKWVKEPFDKFQPDLKNLKGNIYLEGYFTSEHFFDDQADIIRKELTLKAPMNELNRQWATRMGQCHSVCISIRRTNFVNNPLHETCFMSFYEDGLAYMAEKLGPEMEVFIWSDDNAWTRENFRPPYTCHYMDHNNPDFNEDLRLMTHCKHHVIPNSTFSWWAAWLGERQGSIIVAPERWLNSTEIEYGHVIPSRWTKIKN